MIVLKKISDWISRVSVFEKKVNNEPPTRVTVTSEEKINYEPKTEKDVSKTSNLKIVDTYLDFEGKIVRVMSDGTMQHVNNF